MTTLVALRIVLAIVCAAHLILGVIGFVSIPEVLTWAAGAFYGASVTLTPQLQHVTRILGAFMLAIGILAACAFRDPWKNRAIIDGIAVLQLLRVSQRLLFAREIQEAFGVSSGRLYLQTAFFLALALVLFLLRPQPETTAGRR